MLSVEGFIGQVEASQTAGFVGSITNPANTHKGKRKGKRRNVVKGCDTLHAPLWLGWTPADHESMVQVLTDAKLQAQAKNAPHLVEVKGVLLEISPRGSGSGPGFPYVFWVDGMQFCMSRMAEAKHAHNAVVVMPGAFMLQQGFDPQLAWSKAQDVLKRLGARLHRHTISRIDEFVDMVGVQSIKFTKIPTWVCRAQRRTDFRSVDHDEIMDELVAGQREGKAAFLALCERLYDGASTAEFSAIKEGIYAGAYDSIQYGSGKEGAGIVFGKRDRVLRCYDKQRELRYFHPERVVQMQSLWGCDDETPVTRVEFQIRSAGLRALGIETFEDYAEHRQELLEYFVDQWAVGCSHYDKRNKERRVVHPLWLKVQSAFLYSNGVDPWAVVKMTSAGDGAAADDGFGPPEDPVAKVARRFRNTGISYLLGAAVHGYRDLQNPAEARHGILSVVESAIDELGLEKFFGRYCDRRIRHLNKCGQRTADEGWRLPLTQAEMIEKSLDAFDSDPPHRFHSVSLYSHD